MTRCFRFSVLVYCSTIYQRSAKTNKLFPPLGGNFTFLGDAEKWFTESLTLLKTIILVFFSLKKHVFACLSVWVKRRYFFFLSHVVNISNV